MSLDGPPAVHNSIRRVPDAFRTNGGRRQSAYVNCVPIWRCEPVARYRKQIIIRCARSQPAPSRSACASVSFLAADLTSSAFNRPDGWLPGSGQPRGSDSRKRWTQLELEMEQLIGEHSTTSNPDLSSKVPDKASSHRPTFSRSLRQAETVAPRCNAPWVSAVIEASGDVRPCFFHPVLGNIHQPIACQRS